MAHASLENFFIPESAAGTIMQGARSSSRIIASGAMGVLPDSVLLMPSAARVILPYWNEPDDDSQVLDEDTDLVVGGVSGSDMTAAVLGRALVYGRTDLQKLYTGEDPVGAVISAVSTFWGRDQDKVAVAVLTGFMNTVVSGGSMAGNVLNISGASGAAAYIDADSVIDAVAVMGEDMDTALSLMIVHPKVYAYLKKQNLLVTEKPSDGGAPITTYEGKLVIMSKRAPVTGSGAAAVYTTIFVGRGALAYKDTPHPEGDVEIVREGLKGGGRSAFISRRVFTIHPIGADWIGTPAKNSASNAELVAHANWKRAFELENVRIVGLKHKIAA